MLAAVFDLSAENIVELLRVAREHCLAVESLLVNDLILPIPAPTLVRSIHEITLRICWLTDPSLAPEQRLTRAAASTLGSIQSSLQTLEHMPNPPAATLRDKTDAVDDLQTYLSKCGFTLNHAKQNSRFALNLSYGTALANLTLNVTDASRRYMPGSHYMWPVGSGATHSRNWFTAGLAGSRGQLAIMAASPLLDFADALVDNTLGYLGLDPSPFHERTHLRRRALLQRAESHDPGYAVATYTDYANVRDQ